MSKAEIINAANKLWDYHKIGHALEKSDAILVQGFKKTPAFCNFQISPPPKHDQNYKKPEHFNHLVLGSHDLRVAERGAQLYVQWVQKNCTFIKMIDY